MPTMAHLELTVSGAHPPNAIASRHVPLRRPLPRAAPSRASRTASLTGTVTVSVVRVAGALADALAREDERAGGLAAPVDVDEALEPSPSRRLSRGARARSRKGQGGSAHERACMILERVRSRRARRSGVECRVARAARRWRASGVECGAGYWLLQRLLGSGCGKQWNQFARARWRDIFYAAPTYILAQKAESEHSFALMRT